MVLKKLATLKDRSVDELRVRTKQALSALGERCALVEQAHLPQDAELLRSLNGTCERHRITSASSLLDYYRRRTEPAFFAGFDDRAATLAELRRRWPGAEKAVIAAAGQVAQGRFRLMGFDELEYGDPVDWHLEPLSGKRAPLRHWSRINYLDAGLVGDKKIIWELNRCQHFVTLGEAYWYTDDERYADIFVSQLTGWMDSNPPKRGINWASSLEVAFRAISWLWALHFFRESPRLTEEVFARALKFLYLHARHLETYLSTYFSPNTHLTGEALGLLYLGLLLPEFHRADQWRELGQKILLQQLDRHVRPDGVYFEQASFYHCYTTEFYTHLYLLAQRHGLFGKDSAGEACLKQKLTALLDHLMYLTKPGGTTPLVGDDDGGRLVKLSDRPLNDFRATLSTGAALLARGDYKHVAGEAAEETLWLLGPNGLREFDEIASRVPAHLSLAFENGGYYPLRDGWARDSSYLLIDCGPHGALNCGHAHADALSFEFAANGANWLVDPGTVTYTGDAALRDELRGTAAHNTATVDGQPQSVPAGPFSWSHVAKARTRTFLTETRFDYFAGEHDGYQRLADPVTHARSVLFVKADDENAMPGYFVVRDFFAATSHHQYSLHYHFDSSCKVSLQADDTLHAHRPDGDKLILRWAGSTELRPRVGSGLVSRCYGHRVAAPTLVCEAGGEGAQRFLACLLPVNGNAAAVSFDPGGEGLPAAYGLRIRSGAVTDAVLMGDGKSRLETGLLSACGEVAWARAVDGRMISAGLVQGLMLTCADGFAFCAPDGVRHCGIERRGEEIEIRIRGGRCFRLVLPEPATRIIINGACRALGAGLQRAAFVRDSAGWRLSEIDC